MTTLANRIRPEVLAEQYFLFMQQTLSRLQSCFRRSSVTQKEIAERIGKQPAVVSRCLAGQENMTIRTMHDLARGMNCRLDISVTALSDLKPANRPIKKQQQVETQAASASGVVIFGSVQVGKSSAISILVSQLHV